MSPKKNFEFNRKKILQRGNEQNRKKFKNN